MSRLHSLWRVPRGFVVGLSLGLLVASAGVVAAGGLTPPTIKTPKTASQVTNLDILRSEIKNYYGTPGASTGNGATAGWTLALDTSSNYAKEAAKVAKEGRQYIDAKAGKHPMQAIVLDVDDTTLTTWDYELYSNWDYNPGTNTAFVGGTNTAFTGNVFPAAPGMVQMVNVAHALGYAVFFITGRPDSQHNPTIANLVSDTAAGYSDATTATVPGPISPTTVPDVDAGYPMPTAVDIGHGGPSNGGNHFKDGLFTKPAIGDYPAYLNQAQFCASYITAAQSCPTIQYKSGTRAYIESLGYTIVGNFGDQFSDLLGGFAVKNFKMPNPNYYLP